MLEFIELFHRFENLFYNYYSVISRSLNFIFEILLN